MKSWMSCGSIIDTHTHPSIGGVQGVALHEEIHNDCPWLDAEGSLPVGLRRDNERVDDQTTTLFRPVGPRELELLKASGWLRWPPRLPEQPVFYPVTNAEYATEIAAKWNVAESGAGYVTRFSVRSSFLRRFEVHCVGAAHHTEWWMPAEQLEELNDAIVGTNRGNRQVRRRNRLKRRRIRRMSGCRVSGSPA